MDPLALTEEDFSKEITIIKPKIEAAKTITVVGAGALGIEVAGEIKDTYRDKHVILIHPHGYIPPEVYAAKNFISALGEQVHEVGVDLRLNTRVKKELENGNLITTNDEVIESDLTLWCHSHTNNIEPLLPFFQDSIDLKSNEVIVDTNMLVKGYDNVFVAGDVTNFPIIKTAGGAFRQGEKVAQTLLNFIVKGEKVYERINLDEWPRGMTVVVGVHRSVTQWDDTSDEGKGKVISNDKEVLEFYADYCTNNTRLLLNINE
jgi:NADH dehydrogenase FAD-containing subunit